MSVGPIHILSVIQQNQLILISKKTPPASFLLLIDSLAPVKIPLLPFPQCSSNAVSRAAKEEPIISPSPPPPSGLNVPITNTGAVRDPVRKEGARGALAHLNPVLDHRNSSLGLWLLVPCQQASPV